MTQTTKAIADITTADLISAYNGRPGCACGCRGTHSYMDAAEGTAKRGYPVDAEEVRPRSVAATLRTIQRAAALGDPRVEDGRSIDLNGRVQDLGYVAYETDTRLYIVYPR